MNPVNDTARQPVKLVLAKPKVEIGCKYTGKREVHYDTRTGTYSESLPSVTWDEWLIQQALCPPAPPKPRMPKDIRQPS